MWSLHAPALAAGVLLATAAWAAQGPAVARPGTLNYTEGKVTLDGRSIAASALGRTELAPGQTLRTESGRAEVLLTPGVFLRLGNNSALRMVSSSLIDTRAELLKGEAMVEVAQLEKENRIGILDNGTHTQLLKKGLYAFNATEPAVSVYDGKAKAQVDDRAVEIGKGKELPLTTAVQGRAEKLKPRKFDKNETDDLYAWSKLRSRYLAEANRSSAETIVATNPAWYYGTGWYWNPWFDTWSFVPGAGYLNSPFGWGFYSPSYYLNYPPAGYYYGGRIDRRPGRIWRGQPGQRAEDRTPEPRTPAPPAGGNHVHFGSPRSPAPAAAAPPPPQPSAPAPAAPAPPPAGGNGVQFGNAGPRR